MTLPTSYTPEDLAIYMVDALGKTATSLGITPESLGQAVIDAVLLYGVEEISDATDIPKLRACARYTAWKRAWAEAAADFDFTADGRSYRRSQRFGHIDRMLGEAISDLGKHGVSTGGALDIYEISYHDRRPVTEFS